MGKLLCLCLFKGKCLHSQQLCAALGQISAFKFPPQVVQSISKKPAHVFWAWYLAFNMETLNLSGARVVVVILLPPSSRRL